MNPFNQTHSLEVRQERLKTFFQNVSTPLNIHTANKQLASALFTKDKWTAGERHFIGLLSIMLHHELEISRCTKGSSISKSVVVQLTNSRVYQEQFTKLIKPIISKGNQYDKNPNQYSTCDYVLSGFKAIYFITDEKTKNSKLSRLMTYLGMYFFELFNEECIHSTSNISLHESGVDTFQINDEECIHKHDRCIPVLSTEKEEEPQPGASAPLERLACQIKTKNQNVTTPLREAQRRNFGALRHVVTWRPNSGICYLSLSEGCGFSEDQTLNLWTDYLKYFSLTTKTRATLD
jgi:hypothetical protein